MERFKMPFIEISKAIKEMPTFMWKLSAVYLFQWYALFVYWQFIVPLFRMTMGIRYLQCAAQAAKMSTTYNIVTVVVALALVPLTLKYGGKKIYAASLFGTGLALLAIPYIADPVFVLFPMVLVWHRLGSHDGNTLYHGVKNCSSRTTRGVYGDIEYDDRDSHGDRNPDISVRSLNIFWGKCHKCHFVWRYILYNIRSLGLTIECVKREGLIGVDFNFNRNSIRVTDTIVIKRIVIRTGLFKEYA